MIGIALDADNGGCIFYKNNTRILEWSSFTVAGPYFFGFDRENPTPTTTHTINFGQRSFSYTPPTGFKALNTANLPEPTIKKGGAHFNTVTYTGSITDTSSQAVTGVGFQSDWTWIKRRDGTNSHQLVDVVRGTGKWLESNNTNTENSTNTNGVLTSFDSNGFTLTGGSTNANLCCESGNTYVAWNWKANGAGSSNTDGTITSTVSANASAGFSIVSFNSGSSGSKTVGHGLGVAPKMIITKDRDNATNWTTYHASATTATDQYLNLNGTLGVQSASNIWGTTLPTSSVFGFGSGTASAPNANVIAYCFSEVAGYSKFGSYTGNSSSDGVFVHCL